MTAQAIAAAVVHAHFRLAATRARKPLLEERIQIALAVQNVHDLHACLLNAIKNQVLPDREAPIPGPQLVTPAAGIGIFAQ